MIISILLGSALSLSLKERNLPDLPLIVKGNQIVDKNGQNVRLKCTEWSGAHLTGYVVNGLDKQSVATITDLISQKFNCVRLAFSIEMVYRNQTIDSKYITKEPLLQGKTPIQAFETVVDSLTSKNIMVILDNQISNAGWCCDQSDNNGLWFNEFYPEEVWMNTWELLIRKFQNNPLVIAADIRNEVRPSVKDKKMIIPYWGQERLSVIKPLTNLGHLVNLNISIVDWQKAAQTLTNRLLAINPKMLISVGSVYDIEAKSTSDYLYTVARLKINSSYTPVPSYLPDLTKYAIQPREQVIYSVHEYSFLHASLEKSKFMADIERRWSKTLESYPVFMGEVGTDLNGPTAVQFWDLIRDFIKANDNLSWSIWCLDGTVGPRPGYEFGANETYGLLDMSWSYYRDNRADALQ